MKSPLRNLPKSVKYLVCYLPFILVGTVLIVVGIFQENSARIASIIVGIVVLLSGLFAWCTDTEVGCLLICRYSSKQKQKKASTTEQGEDEKTRSPTTSELRTRSNDIEAAINNTTTFTITNNRTTIINRNESPTNNNYDDTRSTEKLTSRMINQHSISRFGKYSLQQKPNGRIHRQMFGDDTLVKEGRGAFALRNRNGDPIDGSNFGNFNRGIKKNRKSRLTISNVTALNKGMINRGYRAASEDLENVPYDPSFNIEFFMDRVKHTTICNWVTDVTNSMEDISQTTMFQTPAGLARSRPRNHKQSSIETTTSSKRTDSNSLPPTHEEDENHAETRQESEEDTTLAEDTHILNSANTTDIGDGDGGGGLGDEDEHDMESDHENEEYDLNDFMGSVSSNGGMSQVQVTVTVGGDVEYL